jgi:TonB family protein
MKKAWVVLGTLLAYSFVAFAAGRDENEDRSVADRRLDEAIGRIPIKAVPTSTEARNEQRSRGERVMLIEGRPGYVYREILHANVLPSGTGAPGAPGALGRGVLSKPQENPDVYGCVTVSFDIRPDGKTDGFEVVKAEPPRLFDKHALRAVYATEYEPLPPGSAQAPSPRQQRSIFFLVARPPRSEASNLNEAVEDSRNKRREEQRVACEGPGA